MLEAINQQQLEAEPLQKIKDLTAQWANYFNGIQQVLADNERLQQRVAALEACVGKGQVGTRRPRREVNSE